MTLPLRPVTCFIGTRLEALQTVQKFCDVRCIVTVRDSWVDQDCKSSGIAPHLVTQSTKESTFRFLSSQSVRLVVSAGFPFILPGYVLSSGPIFINSHPSLLPDYKGYNAIRDAFGNGEKHMGVTVHHMTEDVDEGAPIVQEMVCVKGLGLQEIYDLLFRVIEPTAISRSLETLRQCT